MRIPGRKNATLIGLVAIVLWSSLVGLIRSVSESLGATGGAAMIYTVASLLLLVTVGFTPLRAMPRKYLYWGSALFVSYELCLALSIGHAHSGQQAIEVGMVNYLWPTFTMLAAIAFNAQRANWLVLPGLLTSLAGIAWVLGGEQGMDLSGMLANVQRNPLSYGLALAGAGAGVGIGWPHLLVRVLTLAPAGEGGMASAAITTVQLYGMAIGAAIAGLVANAAGLIAPGGVAGAQSAAVWLFASFAIAPLLAALLVRAIARPAPRAIERHA